jgi:cytochrome b561
MTPETRTPPAPQAPVIQAVIIWGMLMASQGMIVIVSQTAMTKTISPPDQFAPASAVGTLHPLIFISLAVGAGIAALMIPKLIILTAKKSLKATGQEPTLQEIAARVFPALFSRWMFIEMILLVGFMSSMLSADPSAIYPFAAASFIGFVLTFPTEQKFRAILQ